MVERQFCPHCDVVMDLHPDPDPTEGHPDPIDCAIANQRASLIEAFDRMFVPYGRSA